MNEQVLRADLTWTGQRFEAGVDVRLDAAGRIVEVGRLGLPSTRELRGRALLPGFVNAHSHAFQRGLRGRGETFPAGAGSFWTWREAMYGLVAELDREAIYQLSFQAFREMLACGITTVGEFHYVHHQGPGQDFELDGPVVEAASEAGIRMVLLQVFYKTGGIGQPLQPGQQRFATPSREAFWTQVDKLEGVLDPKTQSLGIVVHSLRAAEIDDLVALHREAMERGLVFHIHMEEQRQEIEAAVEAYGQRPMQVLNEKLEISPATTAVHCTHTDPGDMARYLEAGGNVCICPLTEANLADGIADLPGILANGTSEQLSLGSDSNARISMIEEMRWLEYVQRLARERRGVCRAADGEVGRELFHIATSGGARALGLPVGQIEVGHQADFFTLDLRSGALAGCDAASLLDAMIFGAPDRVVSEVMVGGRWL